MMVLGRKEFILLNALVFYMQVDSAMMELTQWKSEIENLRDSCPLLLFFSIPKAILLYQLLCEDPCSRSTNMITSEVCFLLPVAADKTHKKLKQLKSEVEVCCLLLHSIMMVLSIQSQLPY